MQPQESAALTRCLVEISLASNAPTRLKTQVNYISFLPHDHKYRFTLSSVAAFTADESQFPSPRDCPYAVHAGSGVKR